MTDILEAELHCHNIFSNYRSTSLRIPFDCGVSIQEQLQTALEKKINVLFITNHNTLDGYRQALQYQQYHDKYRNIKIYPAEEITIDNQGHVIAYGITREIKSGMTFEETLDEIKRQDAVSCAAHPFAVANGIRERAQMCDMIESFNSNNVDRFSNIVAERFAKENKLPTIAGSDSHIESTIGRCTNIVESENNLDSIMQAMHNCKFKIHSINYITKGEIFEYAHYILSYSRSLLLDYFLEHHPRFYFPAKLILNSYTSNPDRQLWWALGAVGLYLTKRASKKVNIQGYEPYIFQQRSWKRLISISLVP
jgi:predicted metal-dependent phosphoesterase TrpH